MLLFFWIFQNYVSENGQCALNIVLNSNSNSNQLIHKILKKANKTILNVKNDENYTPLMQLLIDSEITINSLNDEQQIIRCIDLMSDDTLNTIGYDDKTALHFACEGGYETIGLKLAQRMSKNAINHYCMNSYDGNDRSALYCACTAGLSSLALMLVNLSTDEVLNDISNGISTFQYACMNSFVSVVFAMLPRLNKETIHYRCDNMTALTIAYKRKSKKMISALEKYV